MPFSHSVGEARPVVRCQACHLNQFLTSSGECRRCHQMRIGDYHLVMPIPTDPATPSAAVRSFRNGVGTFLRAIRIERGLTQNQLAVCLHTHRTFISRVECGHRFPPLAMLAHASILIGLDKAIVILCRRELKEEGRAGRAFARNETAERSTQSMREGG